MGPFLTYHLTFPNQRLSLCGDAYEAGIWVTDHHRGDTHFERWRELCPHCQAVYDNTVRGGTFRGDGRVVDHVRGKREIDPRYLSEG